MMAWVAFDRAVKAVEQFDLPGPVDHWRALRDEIHRQVLERGYDAGRNTFVQHYDGKALDASLLLMASAGFLPPEDPRFRGTVEAIERELLAEIGRASCWERVCPSVSIRVVACTLKNKIP